MNEQALGLNSLPRFVAYITPKEYSPERLGLEQCVTAVSTSQVRYRGWYFPHIDRRQRPSVGGHREYVFQSRRSSVWSDHVEEWRMYRTGQFAFRGMVWEHTNENFQRSARQNARYWDSPIDPSAIPEFLEFRMMIALITEAYTFAARLAQAANYDDSTTINVGFRGVNGFGLASAGFGIDLYDPFPVQVDDPHFERDVATRTLIAEPWALARDATKRIFEEFGWINAPPQMIAQHQADLLGQEHA